MDAIVKRPLFTHSALIIIHGLYDRGMIPSRTGLTSWLAKKNEMLTQLDIGFICV